MRRRFAIVIGVAAAGVMALGAQTTTAAPDVVEYDTELSIYNDRDSVIYKDRELVFGFVESKVSENHVQSPTGSGTASGGRCSCSSGGPERIAR